MSDTMTIKRGDLLPALTITLTDGVDANGDPVPVDLTPATTVRVIGFLDNSLLFNRGVTGNAQGVVTMPWQAGDTDVAGDIYLEVEVTWPGSLPQTFPPDGYEVVHVMQDLA